MRDRVAKQHDPFEGFHSILAPLSLNTAQNRFSTPKKHQTRQAAIDRKCTSLPFMRTRSNPETEWSSLVAKQSPRARQNRRRIRSVTTFDCCSSSDVGKVEECRPTLLDFNNHQRLLPVATLYSEAKVEGQEGDRACELGGEEPTELSSIHHHLIQESQACPSSPTTRLSVEIPWPVDLFSGTQKVEVCGDLGFTSSSPPPSSPFSEKSTYDSSLTAYSASSPLSNKAIEQFEQLGETEKDFKVSDSNHSVNMKSAHRYDSDDDIVVGVLRRKRAFNDSIEDRSNKKRRGSQITSEGQKTVLEVIVNNRIPSPYSTTPKKVNAISLLPSSTSTTSKVDEETEEEDSDDEINLLPLSSSTPRHTFSSSTGEHIGSSSSISHNRTPMEKWIDYLEDVFEAENDVVCKEGLVPAHESLTPLSRLFFVIQDGEPVLKNEVVAVLVRLALACPTNVANADDTSSGPTRWIDMDKQELIRIIKLMHRGMERALGIDPFPRSVNDSPTKKSIQAKTNQLSKRRSSAALSPEKGASKEGDVGESTSTLSKANLNEMSNKLSRIAYSAMVTDACLVLLSKEGTSDMLLCEDILLPCLHVIKTSLDNVIVPYAETCCGMSSYPNPLIDELAVAIGSSEHSSHHHQQQNSDKSKSPTPTRDNRVTVCADHLSTIFRSIQASLPRVEKLLKRPGMILSETMAFLLANSLLPTVLLLDPEQKSLTSSTSPQMIKLTALSSLGGGQTPMKSLRLSAIHLLRQTYERSEEQSTYIISSILDGMQALRDTRKQARKQYVLTNGKAICSSSALLLQIIQTSSLSIERAKLLDDQLDFDEETVKESKNNYDLSILRQSQAKAGEAAVAVVNCLLEKLEGTGVATKSAKGSLSVENGFGNVIESFVSDLLDTLFCPEWPASALLLGQLGNRLVYFLNDDKGSHELRGVALDQLGVMAMRLKESWKRCKSKTGNSLLLDNLATIRATKNTKSLERLNTAYWDMMEYLKQRTDEDGSMESAARFLQAQWAHEMGGALRQTADVVEDMPEDESESDEVMFDFLRHLDTMIDRMVNVSGSTEEKNSLVRLEEDSLSSLSMPEVFERLVHTFGFLTRLDAIESQLVEASNGPNATNRNKALRGLTHISDVDETFLKQVNVRMAVERCLYDESVHVRDTAVALHGKFALAHPEYMNEVLPRLAEKILDTGLLVRKRTLRLFKEIYDTSKESSVRVKVAIEIVRCVFDEEETMRDLAVEITSQIWFDMSTNSITKSPVKGSRSKKLTREAAEEGEEEEDSMLDKWKNEEDKAKAQFRLDIMVQVNDALRGKPSPVEEMLRHIVKRREGNELQLKMGQLVDLTVDNIVESQQESSIQPSQTEELTKQVGVIALLTRMNPATLSIRKAKLLLPYLRGGSTKAEIALLGLLLSIFNTCLPIMPSTALSFAKQLQPLLTPLLSKPSQHFPVLEDLIKCYCTVVRWHTHDYSILIQCMQVTYRQLKRLQDSTSLSINLNREVTLMMVTSLLAENADFDLIRTEHPEHRLDINQVSTNSIAEEVAIKFVTLMKTDGLRMVALSSLRFVCRSFPKLLMLDKISEMMELILEQGTDQERSAVLSIVEAIMAVESTKFDPDQVIKGKEDKAGATTARDVKVGREELAGTSEALSNPVTFEVVENYGELIQPLAVKEKLQRQVLEIVQVIVIRGICHPLQCLSTIISLQSVMNDQWVSSKAQTLHRHLISKNNSSISVQHSPYARSAWEFQSKRGGWEVRGFQGEEQQQEALFETWYTTIREQRKTRLDFLKALVKAFDVNISTGECDMEDVHYARFISENLAMLHYKTAEEVILVAHELQNVIDLAGGQVQISAQMEIPVEGEEEEEEEIEEEDLDRAIVIGRMSTIISIAILLRDYIRDEYGLSEGRIARGVEKKASNAVAVRRGQGKAFVLDNLPGAWKRKEGFKLAKSEMSVFENLFDSEGMGLEGGEDYDMED